MEKIAVLGSGVVGETLADGLLRHGYSVMRGSREPQKLESWREKAGTSALVGTFAEAAAWGQLVILAVKGTAAEAAVSLAGPDNLAGKPVLDATNPIADLPPDNGVLRFFTSHDQSLMERLQAKAPRAHFVKAFSCVGSPFMVDPQFPGGKPTMFICGNDASAKERAERLLVQLGWESSDMGGAESARAIEPLCMLWCIPGLRSNTWGHAFKLLRLG